MCRVVMFTNFKKVKNNKAVVEYLGNELLKYEKDGFGYAIQGINGVYGEKFIGKTNEFETLWFNKTNQAFMPQEKFLINRKNQAFGKQSKANGGALFHGRTSTNKLGFKNTHPIAKHGWTLIHNGVVTDHGPKYPMITDNDTEHLVERLATGGIDSLSKNLTGYYAFGAFDPKGQLHIGRDSTARLFMAKIPELETLIFATTQDLIKDFCDTFEYERTIIETVKDDIYMIFDNNGNIVNTHFFESRGWDDYSSGYAKTSLAYLFNNSGYESDSTTFDKGFKDDPIAYDEDEAKASYYGYLNEIERDLDASYTITDWNGAEITVAEFKALDETSQVQCLVIRPDGTVCDPEDYYNLRFADELSESEKQ